MQVWVYWPDNNRWYEAQVEEVSVCSTWVWLLEYKMMARICMQVNRQSKTLTLYYPEDEQQEVSTTLVAACLALRSHRQLHDNSMRLLCHLQEIAWAELVSEGHIGIRKWASFNSSHPS
jgi:hypothetical protein